MATVTDQQPQQPPSAILVEASVFSDAEDAKDEPPSIRFIGRRVGEGALFRISPERGAPAQKWASLAEACETQNAAAIDWEPTNGSMEIIVYSCGIVRFDVARHGDGNGGHVQVCVPAAACAGAFREAARLTAEWLA